MREISLSELIRELGVMARSRGHKVLFCAGDVAAALSRELPAPSPPSFPGSPFHDAGVIAGLLAVDIVITPDAPPGAVRLVHHYDMVTQSATCQVRGETVIHDRCLVVLEGTVAAADLAPLR